MASNSKTIVYPNAPSRKINSRVTIQPPLSRRGRGPGLVLLVDSTLDLRKHEKTLDPPPLQKWAEEGFTVAQIEISESPDTLGSDLTLAFSELSRLDCCDQTTGIGIVLYTPVVVPTIWDAIDICNEFCAVICYGASPVTKNTKFQLLAHVPGAKSDREGEFPNVKSHYYTHAKSCFAIPAHEDYHASSASVAHTRTLSFLKPLVHGPYFDLEKIWDEHTYWEFEARSVEETMATMVEEPYVNHVPTLTGGIGRKALTEFYTNHFVFSNPPDTELELVSRTVGIDRVVDEFLLKLTHDRVIDWLIPGVPPTGKYISVPFTSVVNIRGDRLYHEHINWDQGTLLRQLGLLPDYLTFPYPVDGDQQRIHEYRVPVAGVESARKLTDESSVESNAMLQYTHREKQ
ncbi:carboxymethylenebutenolidase [Whalleya microplaca]|nr:carboxymethylenebutenolidase [Whalleya microplaca]